MQGHTRHACWMVAVQGAQVPRLIGIVSDGLGMSEENKVHFAWSKPTRIHGSHMKMVTAEKWRQK